MHSVARSLGQGARCVYMIKKIQPVVEKKIQPKVANIKRQASSSKQRLTMVQGCYRINILTNTGENMSEYKEKNIRGEVVQLRRIADTLDTIVAMIKADQERSQKYMEERKDD